MKYESLNNISGVKDIVGAAETGSGKTLVFAIPMIQVSFYNKRIWTPHYLDYMNWFKSSNYFKNICVDNSTFLGRTCLNLYMYFVYKTPQAKEITILLITFSGDSEDKKEEVAWRGKR